ncbi:MAG: hypothetical protein ACOYOT_13400 [Bacteroidales bacterium]
MSDISLNKIKNLLFATVLMLSFFSCKNEDKAAEERLSQAQKLTNSGLYSAAKLQIDSIRSLYPNSYKVVKKAVLLFREVERLEQSRNSIFCDKAIAELTAKSKELQSDFVFEKNAEYQEIGYWVLPNQRVERNLRRSYLRCCVSERGEMMLTSVYCGSRRIDFNAIRVITTDGIFAETLEVPYDGGTNFQFVDEGMTSQIVTYARKKENGVSGFIRLYAHQNIKVEYLGGKPFSYTLDEETKKAVLKTYALSQVMSDLHRYQQEKKVADAKLIYLAKKNAKTN